MLRQSGRTVPCLSKHALFFLKRPMLDKEGESLSSLSVKETFIIIPGHSSLLSPSGTTAKTNNIRICFCSFSLVSVQQRWCRALEMRERERKSCEKPNSAREWDFYNLSPSWPGSMKTLSLNLWLLTHWAFLTTECKCKSLRMWNYRQ